jgi:hypothetical protein
MDVSCLCFLPPCPTAILTASLKTFYIYTYAASAWLAIQGLALAATPRLIVTLLLDDSRAQPTGTVLC